MILRRFILHVTDQNWFAVGLDVIVVIVGIFLGMQVTDWNEANNKVKSEIRYLKALNQDLERIDDRILDKIKFETIQAKLANYTYELLTQKDLTAHKKRIAVALSDLTSRRTAIFSSPVYIDLLSSGNLTIIRNDVLRTEVIDYFSFLEARTLIFEKNSKQFVDEGFLPLIRNNFSTQADSSVLPEEYIWVFSSTGLGGADEIITTNILNQSDPSSDLPTNSPIWQDVRRALSWRIDVAIGDKASAEMLRLRGVELSQKISSYILSIE